LHVLQNFSTRDYRKYRLESEITAQVFASTGTKMTVATDKLVYDISPAKTDSFKLVDQFLLFFKTM